MRLARDLGLAERVKFVGFIPDSELVAYYEACDVFCMPSVERAEQFGLVQLEAMYCAKPVVATRLGTGVEYVTLDGETGLLVTDEGAARAGRRTAHAAGRPRVALRGWARPDGTRRAGFLGRADGAKDRDVYRRVLAATRPTVAPWIIRHACTACR